MEIFKERAFSVAGWQVLSRGGIVPTFSGKRHVMLLNWNANVSENPWGSPRPTSPQHHVLVERGFTLPPVLPRRWKAVGATKGLRAVESAHHPFIDGAVHPSLGWKCIHTCAVLLYDGTYCIYVYWFGYYWQDISDADKDYGRSPFLVLLWACTNRVYNENSRRWWRTVCTHSSMTPHSPTSLQSKLPKFRAWNGRPVSGSNRISTKMRFARKSFAGRHEQLDSSSWDGCRTGL